MRNNEEDKPLYTYRRIRPLLGIIISFLLIFICLTPQLRTVLTLPEYTRLMVGEADQIELDLPAGIQNKMVLRVMEESPSVFASYPDPPVVVHKSPVGYELLALRPGQANVQLNLFGYIPIKSIRVEAVPIKRLVPGGHSIGVLLRSRGIMVVGFAPVVRNDGSKHYPGKEQGIQIGDLITGVDGKKISSELDLARSIDRKQNQTLELEVRRKGKELHIPVTPVHCPETDRYRVGLYVRDGVVGVGTMTFWDPESSQYAALGHIIVDADTHQDIDVLKGRVVSASIQTIKPGKPGRPGEKIGIFDEAGPVSGNIIRNTSCGIFGKTEGRIDNPFCSYAMEVGYAHQVKPGKAQIMTVVNGDDIECFDIEIVKVYPQRQNGKGMVIRITDPRLISLTGGIVQGMSGSPIIQDNKLIGAVTHVFLNDPESGYGIFMDNMLKQMPDLEKSKISLSTNYRKQESLFARFCLETHIFPLFLAYNNSV